MLATARQHRRFGNEARGDTERFAQKSGSRNSDGNVPNANWNDGKFRVNWYNLDNSNSDNGIRSEVSEKIPLIRRDFSVLEI